METIKLIKINSLLFASYLVIYFVAKLTGFELFSFLQIILGIAVFFITGFNCAVFLEKTLKLEFDFTETLMIGVIISLFFIPLIIFLSYQIIGTVKEWLNLLIYVIVSSISLILLAYKENAKRKI